MEPAAAKAEAVFSQALKLLRGQARTNFIAEQCAEDAALRQEVESLIEAHEQSGEFLNVGLAGSLEPSPPTTAAPRTGTVAMNAADYADAFLRRAGETANPPVEDFIAGLPAALQREVGERIEAGLRVPKLLSRFTGSNLSRAERPPNLPGFRIERKLGEGSLGVVYAARDEKLERRVALKVLRPQSDGEVRRRVLQEARKAAALADPAVVTIYSVLDESQPPAIVRELVEGYSLDRCGSSQSFTTIYCGKVSANIQPRRGRGRAKASSRAKNGTPWNWCTAAC